jgi:prolyl-tRNA editing enzyme YbaK/EbsC (Cys-tRNA(Pro) deacylase)
MEGLRVGGLTGVPALSRPELLAAPVAAALTDCVVVGGRRDGVERVAACVVRADTRADVNNLVKRRLDVRKASFLAMEQAVQTTGMEYGGITPVGLPPEWRLFVDESLTEEPVVVLGSGLRRSKLLVTGTVLAQLPGSEVVPGLGV